MTVIKYILFIVMVIPAVLLTAYLIFAESFDSTTTYNPDAPFDWLAALL